MVFFDNDMNIRSTYLPKAGAKNASIRFEIISMLAKITSGDCFIFYQEDTDDRVVEYAHEANVVLSGDKYAARAMVEYRRATT